MLIGGDWAASAIVEGGRSRDLVSVVIGLLTARACGRELWALVAGSISILDSVYSSMNAALDGSLKSPLNAKVVGCG